MTDQSIDFAIIMTSGPDTPKRLASPFFLAATAAAAEPYLGAAQKLVSF